MVFENWAIVVAYSFDVLHRDQEGVVYTWMGYVTKHAWEEARHDVKVTEDRHELTGLHEVVEVMRKLNNLNYVVIGVLLISTGLDSL